MGLKFAKVTKVKSPERAGARDAGVDFYIPDDFETLALDHGDSIVLSLGVKVKLPDVPDVLSGTHEYMLELKNKSGVGSQKGLSVSACVIDASYQGVVILNLQNNTNNLVKLNGSKVGNRIIELKAGDKIIQGVLLLVNTEAIEEVSDDDLYSEKSQRGDKGFGSNYKEN